MGLRSIEFLKSLVLALFKQNQPKSTARDWLIQACLIGSGFHSLVFYFVPQPSFNSDVNFYIFVIYMLLALLVAKTRAHTLVANIGMLVAIWIMSYIASYSGGVHSPVMVWVTLTAALPLMLLGQKWAKFWLMVVILMVVSIYAAGHWGWISVQHDISGNSFVWALLTQSLALVSMVFLLQFYTYIHNKQIVELDRQNAALEKTQSALLQAQSHKDEFIASVGHELRTPMNAILGLNDVLQRELQDQPEEAEMAEHIRDATEQLLRLVNNVLDLSQLEAGRLSLLPQPLALAPMLHGLLAQYQPKAEAKGLSLQLQLDPSLPAQVMLDGARLKQVLVHLLDNALKFTTQGQIELRLHRRESWLRVEVQDSGAGVALEHQLQVFDRFEHADTQTLRAYGGTGLGLAICKMLVQLQGGHIGLKSQLGQGSLFWFELPLQAAPDNQDTVASASAQQVQESPSSALRFLLVDDNKVNLLVARLLLLKLWPQARVYEAGGAQQALSILHAHEVDLIFMDMVMPDIDGRQATQMVRQHPKAQVAQLPIIGLTASNQATDRALCLQAGMNDILTKPLDPLALHGQVQHYLRHHKTPPGSGA